LIHARLDQANFSAANLTNARLDYADFAGADLTKANLCGASLHHVKNLTATQIEDAIGSASTILPPHLQGSVSWSVAKSQTKKECRDLRPRARETDEIHLPHGSPSKRKAVGVLISFALVAAAFMWRHMGEAVPLDLSDAQRGSEPFVIQPSLGTTGDQESQPAAIGALMEEKVTAERQPTADADTSPNPSSSSTIDQTKMTEEHLASEAATVLGKGAKPGHQAASTPEDSYGSKIDEASKGSVLFSAQSRHAVPDVIPAASPTATSPHAIVPDLSAEISTHDPQFTPTTDVPAEAPAVNILEPSAASLLSDTQTRSVVTIPDVQTLPLETGTPPTPIRSPARAGQAKGQNFDGAQAPVLIQEHVPALLPANVGNPPMPIRNPARQGVGGTR
jgi:hypothetical protein